MRGEKLIVPPRGQREALRYLYCRPGAAVLVFTLYTLGQRNAIHALCFDVISYLDLAGTQLT